MASATKSGTNPHARQRAAQYIRMSTDHQEYSPLFQRETIAEYARAHNFRVVCGVGLYGTSIQWCSAMPDFKPYGTPKPYVGGALR
jgi:hypothetical protein